MGRQEPVAPAAVEMERAVLGDMLALPEIVGDVAAVLSGADFYDRTCGTAFDLIVDAWKRGKSMDPVMLVRELGVAKRAPADGWIYEVMESGYGAWAAHAEVIIEQRLRRDGLMAAAEMMKELRDLSTDVDDVLARGRLTIDHIRSPVGRTPEGYADMDTTLNVEDQVGDEWVLPGLMRRGWRMVVVAGEGGGKSLLFRQFAVAASQGIHPLGFTQMGHNCRVLLVDLENPPNLVRRWLRRMVKLVPNYVPGNVGLWTDPRGVDLNSRQGLASFEAAIQAASPSLVLIGPAYKLYRRHARQSDEEAVAEVQLTLDDLRIRYGFALMLEHHAPHGYSGQREMRPVGTSLWLRWPEMGFGLVREKKDHNFPLMIQRWRNDRDTEHQWPVKLDKGNPWPWVGVWEDDQWKQETF